MPNEQAAETQPAQQDITHLVTLQFAYGGLFDSTPTDYLVHLVRGRKGGTPGDTLCGIDRFAQDAPGWSVGGGVDGPGMVHTPCHGCADVARSDFAGLPVVGMSSLSKVMAAELGVPSSFHAADIDLATTDR